MDAKDLRNESAVTERNNDGSKYSQGGGIALHCDRNKPYQDIASSSLGKVDVPNARPCAVIGPDRVLPPPAASEAYHIKKGPAEPWLCMDGAYRRPPEYPHKLTNYQNPTRNISPRQTFQENMQRIMVPPTYSSNKVNEDTNYAQVSDRSNGLSKNIKLNMPPEAKFCDVPYAVNPTNNEHKNVRNPEMCLPSANPTQTRTAPHGWPPGSVNLRSTRMYGAPELYQHQDYPSCAGPRPVVPRPHRTVPEEQGYLYPDPYYQEGNLRFKPYPTSKERYPQQRYEYIGNYSNPFHPPPGFPSHKYESQKPMPPHPYTPYPPIKYLDSRVAEPVLEGYHRNPQALGPNYNIQYRNQVIHPNYGPVVGNNPQSKMHSYPPDAHLKSIPPNKLPYDSNAKAYIEYENSRPKIYPLSESYFVNEMARMPMKSQVIMPNYSTLNMHNIPPNPYYKKDTQHIKNYENMAHFRNMDPNFNIHNPMSRHVPVFSPNTLAISPSDSNTSNDTTQTLGTSQEDCGYVSQSSTASVRSIDSGINRIPNEYLRKYYENRYGPIVRTSAMMSKSQSNSNNNASKDKKQIDVRQYLQMWNEGDEEQEENSSKEVTVQTGSSDKNNFGKSNPHEAMNSQQSQEQLYVLGLVNVPSEELAKYEHIQKVSKLPENIKGYNSIELLNQFEEVIESSHMKNYKSPTPKESMYHMPIKGGQAKQVTGVIPPRPVSPLDVEAKISQSVIHKDVGCNFEIKPCSPKMLNVEVAASVQNVLAERSIEKVVNPVMLRSPMLNGMNENNDCNMMKRTAYRMNMNENLRIPSCKMINTQFSNSNSIDPMKSTYSIHDLESNSGLCLASLPRLDNDIELNFPEVNQQFINANKGDNTVSAIRDLPTLEVLDQSPKQITDKSNNKNSSRPEYDVIKSPYDVVKSPYDVIKSPYNMAKSPYDVDKSPYDVSKSPYDVAKSPYDVKSPYNVVKSPYNVVKSPYNVVISPYMVDKSPYMVEKSPHMVDRSPHMIDRSPHMIDRSPHMIDRSPHMVDRSPHMVDRSPHVFDKSPHMVDSEKECSKLSKYRKIKNFEQKETHIQHNVNALRTDSVIIKNPENIKNHEENSDFSNGLNKVIMEIQQAPINLTSQENLSNNLENKPHTTHLLDGEKEKQLPVEIAIDFSLNKTGILNSTEYMETKLELQINTSTHIKEPPLNTINKHYSSDSVYLLPVFTEENVFFCNVDNKGAGSLDSLKDRKDVSKPIAEINKNNYEVDPKEIPTSNKSYQSTEIETIKCASNGAEVMIVEVSSAKSVSKTKIPVNELVGNIHSENCEKKICNNEKLTTEEANYTLTEIDSKMSSNATESLEKYEIDTAENNTNVPIGEDFGDNHNFVDTFNSPVHTGTKKDFDALEINRSSKISDLMVAEQTLQHDKKNLLTSEETCCNDSESLNFKSTSESKHAISKDYVIGHQNDNIEDGTTQFSFKESYCEDTQSSLEHFDETDCEDTQSSPENLCDIDQAADEDLEHKLDEPLRSNLWYGSKELYSPWIQKLITFSEGNCINATTKNDMDSHSDVVVDTTETAIAESNHYHDDTDLEIKRTVLFDDVTTENNDDHNDSNFDVKKPVLIEEVTIESNDHDDSDFEMGKAIPIEEGTTEKNDDSDDSEFEIKPLPQQEVTAENNDHDDFEMRTSGTIELTTKNIDHDDSDFEMRKSEPLEEIHTESSDHDDSDFELRKSIPTEEVTTEKNYDHNGSVFEIRKFVSHQEAATVNNDHDDSDFEIGKSVPQQEVAKENNDHYDTEISKSISQQEVATENNDHNNSDFETRKSESEETTKENNDHHDSDFEIGISVPQQEVATENNYHYDTEIRKSVSQKEVATENNDHNNSDFEMRKSEPEETTKENNDHDDSDFETRKSEPEEITKENSDYDDSDFETRKSESEEIAKEKSDHDDSDFETRKSEPEEITKENSDHDDSDFETRKSEPEEITKENSDHDDSDFETRKSESEEIAKEKSDHDDSDFETRKSEPEEITKENNDHDDSDFETRKSESEEIIKENSDHYDSDFETRKSEPEEITKENNDHDDSDFAKRKSAPQQEVATENDDRDDSDFEAKKPIPLDRVSHKNLREDVNKERKNFNDPAEEKKTPILDNNLDKSVSTKDHFECENIIKDEAINREDNVHTVDQVDDMAAAIIPFATCEFNETNIIDSSIESEPNNNRNTDMKSEAQLDSCIKAQCEAPHTSSNLEEVLCESFQEVAEYCGEQPEDKEAELQSLDHFENVRFSLNGLQANEVSYKKSQRLKRSLSDSALNMYNNDEPTKQETEENVQFIWPFKRRKINTVENDFLAQNLCSIINHNRRNSVSSFYNEDNVSFCILIDNSCIITEEDNEEPETQNCYTELSEECLAEIQSRCTKHDDNIETTTEVAVSPQQENTCDNSDSFMVDCEEDKTLEESWDEDVGCVETVISDDVAEDIEICGHSSPKEDALSDNDESGVFSCSEHTDKVKFIYGEKMCNDDALFVETLYKTPQMDVNKTLYNRETRVSEDYGRYYDNDSLEKMLSESNEPPVSPYVPQYLEEMFPFGKAHSKETPKNMDTETFPPLQSKGNALDIVVDINVDNNDREGMHSIEFFTKSRDDTTRSCEASFDNVFTYNQKDEDAIYTSSSPEVSSTTSEEKNSGILLKITNYQGSRISQINDISRISKRSSCKFTEEKEYSRTHANYSSNRPLLTKGAQKYIPPLRESIRDLKVKLTLPQHSLMKLKQLKISKDVPKVNKQIATIPRILKKPKPKFEDVLKSIDEIQFKKHKEKTKKTKKAIPKVVIKKTLNGSHYASTSNKDDFNPDLTGRKWQPWVFIEKNLFIDKMATRKKTKAVYSHRKKTYVLAEKFQKYKSANSTKFVISPPISDSPSSGLKYTIRLKHNY